MKYAAISTNRSCRPACSSCPNIGHFHAVRSRPNKACVSACVSCTHRSLSPCEELHQHAEPGGQEGRTGRKQVFSSKQKIEKIPGFLWPALKLWVQKIHLPSLLLLWLSWCEWECSHSLGDLICCCYFCLFVCTVQRLSLCYSNADFCTHRVEYRLDLASVIFMEHLLPQYFVNIALHHPVIS